MCIRDSREADRYWFSLLKRRRGPYIDLYNFFQLLGDYSGELKPITDDILATYEDVVLKSGSHEAIHKNALGLTIYFPLKSRLYYLPSEYETSGLDFVTDTHWDELLAQYFET